MLVKSPLCCWKTFVALSVVRYLQSDARGVMQDSHDALHLASYSQPLRGTPSESLPAAQAAAYVINMPAAAASVSEAALEDGSSPRTPTHRTRSARVFHTLVQHDGSSWQLCSGQSHLLVKCIAYMCCCCQRFELELCHHHHLTRDK